MVRPAIGSAMLAGFSLLKEQTDCWKRTLDLSGDGIANTGPRPQDIGDALLPTGVIVNGLVIGAAAGHLSGLGFYQTFWPFVAGHAAFELTAICISAAAGLMLGSIAKTDGQAAGLGVLAANVLAALGGCWWPIEITPAWMQKLQLFLPTGWAMDALHKLVSFGAGESVAVVAAASIAATALRWLGFHGGGR